MNKHEIMYFALRDADTETDEDLTAAANMYDKLTRNRTQATIVQDDIMGTPLPNGLLQWFGYDFQRVDLPNTPLLKHDDSPIWVGTLPGFTIQTGVADALVVIRAEQFETDEEEESSAAPTSYQLTIRAHGIDQDEEIICKDWYEVQHRCRSLEHELDGTYAERHALCQNEDNNLSEDACAFCERGQKGG